MSIKNTGTADCSKRHGRLNCHIISFKQLWTIQLNHS